MSSPTPPFEPAAGHPPTIFASYDSADAPLVHQFLTRLHQDGFRVWFDEETRPGVDPLVERAQAIEQATACLVFVSPAAAASDQVAKDTVFAASRLKPMIRVDLAPTALPPNLQPLLGPLPALAWQQFPDAEQFYHYLEASLPPVDPSGYGPPRSGYAAPPGGSPAPAAYSSAQPAPAPLGQPPWPGQQWAPTPPAAYWPGGGQPGAPAGAANSAGPGAPTWSGGPQPPSPARKKRPWLVPVVVVAAVVILAGGGFLAKTVLDSPDPSPTPPAESTPPTTAAETTAPTTQPPSSTPLNLPGNVQGNIINVGSVTEGAGQIYFAERSGIFQMSPDGSRPRLIATVAWAQSLVYYDGLIYFSDEQDIRTVDPATGRTALVLPGSDSEEEVTALYVGDDVIHFVKEEVLYRVGIDGSGLRREHDGRDLFDLNIIDGQLYYLDCAQGCRLYRSELDGSGPERLVEGNVNDVRFWDQTLFFTLATDDGYNLMRSDLDGGRQEVLVGGGALTQKSFPNVSADWVFFLDADEHIARVDHNGDRQEVVVDAVASFPNVAGQWLFYWNDDDDLNLWMAHFDGSDAQVVDID
jgi:hypothetical protein